MVNGKPLAVNADFARQVIFISHHLDCSERYVAGILHSIMTKNPNISPANSLEAAIVEFHQRRRHLFDSLRYCLEAAEVGATDSTPRLRKRLYGFVRNEIILEGGKDFSLRVFMEVDRLGNVIAKAQREKQNAVSNTTAPSAQGELPNNIWLAVNRRIYRCQSNSGIRYS
jgi:nuclear pore complex protein Nup205